MVGHHLPASETPFKWRFDGWPMMTRLQWYLDPTPSSTKKRSQSWTSDNTFWIRADKNQNILCVPIYGSCSIEAALSVINKWKPIGLQNCFKAIYYRHKL